MNPSLLQPAAPPEAERRAPIPLPDDKPPVDALPFDALPDCLRALVEDVSARQQCPPDFVAVVGLVALAGALGNRATICPKQLDSHWEVVPNLWGAIIGRPSAMKSPAMGEAIAPLHAMGDELRKQHKQDMIEHSVDSELIDIELKNAKEKAKKSVKDNDREKAKSALREFAKKLEPPCRGRIIVNDPTVPKLGELMNENQKGLVLVRDELIGWLTSLQGEEKQGDRAFYVEAYNGNGRYTFDRIIRGTIDIESMTLSIIGGIQPSKIAPFIRGAVSGKEDDGLIQRMQLTVWPDDVGTWTWNDQAPNKHAVAGFEASCNDLSERIHPGVPYHFAVDAQSLFVEWMKDIQNRARSGNVHPVMESHLLKMPKTVASLALIFELVGDDGNTVGKKSTAMALDFAEYLESHAKRLYSAATNAAVTGARLILNRRNKLESPFTFRELHRKGWTGLSEHDDVEDALDMLLEYNHIRAEPLEDTGGRPTTNFYWIEGV